ncbi:MAG: hypothetical protein LWW98_03840 [Deltaproteobacteria bacterium]|nr:hypothetical protein [Deltaproteobacteria bacterium]
MGTGCIDFDILVDYITGNLPDKKRVRVMEHISECNNCLENIANATRIMGDNDLNRWEPMPEKKALAVLEKVNMNLLRSSPKQPCLKPETIKKKLLEWVRGLTPDFSLQYGFARTHGLGEASLTDHICIKKIFGDFRADIFMEKCDDKFCVQIKVHKNNKMAKNVRVTLTREGGGSVSRLASDGYKLFENLPFGSYQLVLAQKLLNKGSYLFAINKEGIYEK